MLHCADELTYLLFRLVDSCELPRLETIDLSNHDFFLFIVLIQLDRELGYFYRASYIKSYMSA